MQDEQDRLNFMHFRSSRQQEAGRINASVSFKFLSSTLCCVKTSANVLANTKVPSYLFFSQGMAPWRPRPSACSLYYCWLCSASTSECSAIPLRVLHLRPAPLLPHLLCLISPCKRRSALQLPTFFGTFGKNFLANSTQLTLFLNDLKSFVLILILVEFCCGKRLLVNILETDREISLFIYNKSPWKEPSEEAMKTF